MDARQIIDFAADDNAKEMREALYASIYDRVSNAIESKKQEIAHTMLGMPLATEDVQLDEEEEDDELDEAVRVMGSDKATGSMSRPQKGATPDSAEKRKDIANQAKAVRASGKQMRTHIASKVPDGSGNRVMKYRSEDVQLDEKEEDEKMCKDVAKTVAKKEVKGHEKKMHGKND